MVEIANQREHNLISRSNVRMYFSIYIPMYVYVCCFSLFARRLGAAAANYNAATYIPFVDTALFLPSPPKVDVSIVSLATAHDYSGARVRKLISPESLSAIAASVDGSVLAGGKIARHFSAF